MILKHTALFLLVLLAFAGYAQDSVRLKLNLKKGDKYLFSSTTKLQATPNDTINNKKEVKKNTTTIVVQYEITDLTENVDFTLIGTVKEYSVDDIVDKEELAYMKTLVGVKCKLLIDATGGVIDISVIEKSKDEMKKKLKAAGVDKEVLDFTSNLMLLSFTNGVKQNFQLAMSINRANSISVGDTLEVDLYGEYANTGLEDYIDKNVVKAINETNVELAYSTKFTDISIFKSKKNKETEPKTKFKMPEVLLTGTYDINSIYDRISGMPKDVNVNYNITMNIEKIDQEQRLDTIHSKINANLKFTKLN